MYRPEVVNRILTLCRFPRYRSSFLFKSTYPRRIPTCQHHQQLNLNFTCLISARSYLISFYAHPALEASKSRTASSIQMFWNISTRHGSAFTMTFGGSSSATQRTSPLCLPRTFLTQFFFTIELCLPRRHQTHIYIYLQTYFRFWCGCRHSPRSSLSSTRGGFQSWESNLRNPNTSKRSPRLVELPSTNPTTTTTK